MLRVKCMLSLALVLQTTLCNSLETFVDKPKPTPYQDWDYLMFSQRWPITSCSQWEEKSKNNTCDLPMDRSLWSIHGIWPTKLGTDGPYFCHSAIHFDPEQLQPLMDDLKIHWINVEANTKPNSFWSHEWNKHGTCSVNQPQLNSVYNFFNQGLAWNKQYELSKILSSQKIVPQSGGYAIEDIYNAVKNVIKVNPEIQCVVDGKTGESLISEIRICFNKSMELIDCDPTNPNHLQRVSGDILSNCSEKKPVMYLGNVPSNSGANDDDVDDGFDEEIQQHYEERNALINIYRFLKFFIWFTL